MSNIQELMHAVTHRAASKTVPVYALRITPKGSAVELAGTIKSRRPVGEVRETVRVMARRRWPQGFTFSVRPQ